MLPAGLSCKFLRGAGSIFTRPRGGWNFLLALAKCTRRGYKNPYSIVRSPGVTVPSAAWNTCFGAFPPIMVMK